MAEGGSILRPRRFCCYFGVFAQRSHRAGLATFAFISAASPSKSGWAKRQSTFGEVVPKNHARGGSPTSGPKRDASNTKFEAET